MLDDLLVYLVGVPALPGARCRGRAHLFNDRDRGCESVEVFEARAAQAVSLCGGCPALERCRTWVASLEPGARPAGVVAGLMPREALAISAK